MKEGHSAYLACSSVITEGLVEGHLIWLAGVVCPGRAGPEEKHSQGEEEVKDGEEKKKAGAIHDS